ncbi:MAG TPA: GNAT family N-acetyltransferase [Kofleriaceae bacterium]|nr:GNAT family N-acetyltransferase [Kofleriaceae bacterium]
MDARAKLEEVFLAPVGSMIDAPDTRVIEAPGWYQIVTPSSGSTVGNEVVLSQLAGDDAEAVVRRTIAEYAAHRVPFKWAVGPLTAPAGFGAILERHGAAGEPMRGMAIAAGAVTWPVPDDVVVERVTAETMPVYHDAFARGWGPTFHVDDPEAWIEHHRDALARGRHAFYLARIGGEPAGTAGMVVKPRSGYLIGGNVIDRFRRRGVYRALVATRVRELAALGRELATTRARTASSAPILERLGFERVYDGTTYVLSTARRT